ncbi:MAG: MarC family protein, partial [Halorientalis sp.]
TRRFNSADYVAREVPIFILLLIGMGPKVALVPFLDLTADMAPDMRADVAKQMVRTAVTVALFLVIFGSFLMEFFHFSENTLFIAGGIIFLLLSIQMITAEEEDQDPEGKASDRDGMEIAFYPLAVPYLLNPVGITLLIIFSAAADSVLTLAILVAVVLLVGVFDWLLFTNMDTVATHLDESRLSVTETVSGVLLSAVAIELILRGMVGIGVITQF